MESISHGLYGINNTWTIWNQYHMDYMESILHGLKGNQ